MTWIDTPWPQDPKRLKANGYDIMRYICSDWNTGPGTSMPNKRISRAELDSYIAAGVDVAVNFEDAADDYLGGYQRGKDKGQKAGTWMATELGWPMGGVCCSSIDADIGTTWGGLAQEYQQGFADGLTSAGPYLPGIYGSSVALNGANQDGTAVVFWLTAATFWSHGIPPRDVHLRQNGYWPFGSDADLNLTVQEPIGSYLHPLGADMTPDECKAALREVLGISDGGKFTTPKGLPDNDDVLALLVSLTQGQFNTTNKILAAVKPIDQVWLERILRAALADALAAGIPVDVVEQAVKTAVDDALAAATIPVVLTGHAGTPPVTP